MTKSASILVDELENMDVPIHPAWGISSRKPSTSESSSLLRDLSNQIRMFEMECHRQRSQSRQPKGIWKLRTSAAYSNPKLQAPFRRPSEAMVKKTNINFNVREGNNSIHTFRISKPVRKGHARCMSSGQMLPLQKFVLSGNNPTSRIKIRQRGEEENDKFNSNY